MLVPWKKGRRRNGRKSSIPKYRTGKTRRRIRKRSGGRRWLWDYDMRSMDEMGGRNVDEKTE